MGNMKNYNKVKIKRAEKIMICSIVVIILIMNLISFVVCGRMHSYLLDSTEMVVENYAEKVSQSVDKYITEKLALLHYLSGLPEIQGMDPVVQKEYLKDKLDLLGLEYVFVMDTQGNGYYFTEEKVRNQSGETFFDNITEHDQYVTSPFYNGDLQASCVTICSAIYKDQIKVGTLCGVVRCNDLYTIAQEKIEVLKMGVVDEKGSYVIYNEESYIDEQRNIYDVYDTSPSSIEFISDAIENKKTKSGVVDVGKKEYFVAMSPIQKVNWMVCVAMPKIDAMKSLNWIIFIQSVIVVLILFAVIIILNMILNVMSKERVTYMDSLTKISNRAKCNEIMNQYKYWQKKDEIMIIVFDLNDFKIINDSCGHAIGDEALKKMAKALSASFGEEGYVARMGGDEFISILEEKDTEQVFQKCLEVFEKKIQKSNTEVKEKYFLSASYGRAIRKKDDAINQSIEEIVEIADKNMYQYKEELKKQKLGL